MSGAQNVRRPSRSVLTIDEITVNAFGCDDRGYRVRPSRTEDLRANPLARESLLGQ